MSTVRRESGDTTDNPFQVAQAHSPASFNLIDPSTWISALFPSRNQPADRTLVISYLI